jgi:hypothetical protein
MERFHPRLESSITERLARTSLKVYDMLGKEVATLFDELAVPGQYYEVTFDGRNLSSGMYFYRLKNDQKSQLKKLLLLR